ncbi:MAG TPA: shikimate kinase [Pyrinomonadaceae bacterium]|nr:shikimate kinase [Pyrinomonadaceae bacterium]
MTNQHIVIIGFMGTGKSTVARELGRRLHCEAVDLDDLISRHEGRSPNEIIEQDGESRFRELETEQLDKILRAEPARIISAGGGAWTIPANRQLIAARGAISVWLDAPFELCWQRIETSGEIRPLARSREMAQRLYAERRPSYELANTRIFVSEADSAEEVATKISDQLLIGESKT